MTLDQNIASSLARFSEAIGQQIPNDQLYPFFMPDVNHAHPDMHILSQPLHLQLAPEISSPETGQGFRPSTFYKEEHRQAFLRASGFAAEDGERYFPLRDTITIGGNNRAKSPFIFLGTETQLRIPGFQRDNDLFLALVRDSDFHHGKGGLFAPGMTLARSPAICAVSPLNEKTAVVIRRGEDFLLLVFKDKGGVTGITSEEKLRQIPLLLERVKSTYGAAADVITADKIKLLEVELQPDPETNNFEVPVSISYTDGGGLQSETSRHIAQYVPGVKALSLLTAVSMPDNLAGIRPQDLVEGQNLFLADVFSPAFNRPTLLVTSAELRYARSFTDTSSIGWSRYGAMMPGFAWRADRYADVPAARSIPAWKDGKIIQTAYSKGPDDSFRLSPVGAQAGLAPENRPNP